MKFKVIMDSGKEYIVEGHHEDFIKSLYEKVESRFGETKRVMSNTFMFLDKESKVLFNPTHVSSVETID